MPFYFNVNVAPTDRSAVMVTVHLPVPEHAPVQPVNREPEAALALSVTFWPLGKLAEQVAPQLIPPGELVTDPVPVPDLVTVRVNAGLNVAVTVLFALIVAVHFPVPVHAPLHPVKTDPAAALASSVTCCPLA